MFGAVVGLGTAWVGFKGKREDTTKTMLERILQDNQELKEYNRQLLQDNQELTAKVNQLVILMKEMNVDLKGYGKDYTEKIEVITHEA
ncbi:hypothetical protein LNP00_06220 [Fructobacillus sp. M158]|uniref:hypothetical protein n=1 Tax=Fructobacillus parabroussonetiae TaxID=2713174 RepID=UPI00200B77D1|nr:hypothetical protein [Fructobacillus parabroussonetiae]MCK8617947.1 hypothetical protein [Fructobacillus parabroussonetiae]